jgi:flagellar basal body-associated protein FliL
MKENDEQFAGDELDDTPEDDTPNDDTPVGDSRGNNSEPSKKHNLQKKTSDAPIEKTAVSAYMMVLVACLGCCILALVIYMSWTKIVPEKEIKPAIVRVVVEKKPLIELNSFVIPGHGKSDNYISFSVSLKVSDNALLNEVKDNREYLRGKIYDKLCAYLEHQIQMPALETIKSIIENGINDSLSEGKIDSLYITRFLVI